LTRLSVCVVVLDQIASMVVDRGRRRHLHDRRDRVTMMVTVARSVFGGVTDPIGEVSVPMKPAAGA
jgi:hypothetical protein